MFNLEAAISTWVKSLRHQHVLDADDLEELEGHLRQQVLDFIEAGRTEEQAFREAMSIMGSSVEAESEYRKVHWGKVRHRRRIRVELEYHRSLFANYVKAAARSMRRQIVVSSINLTGLAVSIAACLLIVLYVNSQSTFDTFHENSERIYRLGQGNIGWPYGRIVKDEYPEVEDVVYMRAYPNYPFKREGAHVYENILYADDAFFRVFDFPVISGRPERAFRAPYTAVLSRDLAQRYFGRLDIEGETLTMRDSLTISIVGVVDVPRRSHIQFDALISFETLRAMSPEWYATEMSQGWLDLNIVNYVKLSDQADVDQLADKISTLPVERAQEYLERWGALDFKLDLEPLSSLYLNTAYGNALGPLGSKRNVWLLIAVGVFLLFIASANFINLSLARSFTRVREVGVRKSLGSDRRGIIRQFLSETCMTVAFATILGVVLAAAGVGGFNRLAGTTFSPYDLVDVRVIGILIGLVIVLIIAAGFHPAWSISRAQPVDALKGDSPSSLRGLWLRKGLVMTQFTIASVLLIATFVVVRQLDFMHGSALGFDIDDVLVVDASRIHPQQRAALGSAFEDALRAHPGVRSIAQTWAVPGRNGWLGQLSFPEGLPNDESIGLEYIAVDHAYLSTLGMEVIAGRGFSEDNTSDAERAVVINEAAVTAGGWSHPGEAIGKRFSSPGSRKPEGTVIGVVRDYHQHGLRHTIQPIMFGMRDGNPLYAIKVDPSSAASVRAQIPSLMDEFFAGFPYSVVDLSSDYSDEYEEDQRLARIFGVFAGLTVLIACLGLFGLAAFTAARRTKEMGIRKACGASTANLVLLLSGASSRLVLASLIVAAPIGYVVMNMWLAEFAYRTTIGGMPIAVTGLVTLLVAWVSVGYQSLKVARTNPVVSLRYE